MYESYSMMHVYLLQYDNSTYPLGDEVVSGPFMSDSSIRTGSPGPDFSKTLSSIAESLETDAILSLTYLLIVLNQIDLINEQVISSLI